MTDSVLSPVFSFLNAGVSPFHAAAEACRRLDAAGYTRLDETAYWNCEPGRGYYTTRNASSVLAWRVPAHAIGGWRMVACHSDSPCWRVKSTGEAAEGVTRVAVEGYGGMIMPSWLDRPLSAAGRVAVRTEDGLAMRLVDLDRDLLVIPSLAIHMDRTQNEGHRYDPQTDMQPVLGPEGCRGLLPLAAAAAGAKPEDVVDLELSLYVRQKAVTIGPDGEYFMSPRIDDLECAAATLEAFLAAAPHADDCAAPVWVLLDNEEVGSGTRQGAQSTFVRDALARILDAVPHSAQAMAQTLANSFCLSADNAHANHPNFPQKADPASPVRLGGGVVLKYNASQKYTTNALSGGLFREICRQSGVPVQRFANRADLPGGSTLGNLLSHTVPVPMADIGLAQWAMHSAVETASCADAAYMVQAVKAFYTTHLRALADGEYTLAAPRA